MNPDRPSSDVPELLAFLVFVAVLIALLDGVRTGWLFG